MADNPEIKSKYTVIWCILSLMLGIAMIIVALISQEFPEEIFLSSEYKNYKDYFYLSLIIQGSLLIGVSLLAIISFFCHCRFWKIASIIFNFLFFISFLILLAISVDGKKLFKSQTSDDQCFQGDLKEINELFIEFSRIWCRNPCPCKINNLVEWQTEQELDLLNMYLFSQISSSSSSSFGNETLIECPYFEEQYRSEKYKVYVEFLSALETNFECTGLCQGDLVYYFTGINNGHPMSADGCLYLLKEKTERWFNLIFISSLVAVIICFINILIIISSELLPKKRRQKPKVEMKQSE